MINKFILSKSIFITLIFWTLHTCFGQNYQIIYEVKFKPVKESESFIKEYMALKVIEGQSIFYNLNKEKIDSLVSESNFKAVASVTSSLLRLKVFKNLSKDYYSVGGTFNQFDYWYKEKHPRYTHLKKFGSYKGYKATEAFAEFGKRKWSLLYTTDVPINDGPYIFSGLPGLIIKAESLDGDYGFEMIEIKKLNDPAPLKENKENIKKEKLMKNIGDFIKDPAAHHISFKNDLGDSFSYEFSGAKDKNYTETNNYLNRIFTKFDNYPDQDVPIITF